MFLRGHRVVLPFADGGKYTLYIETMRKPDALAMAARWAEAQGESVARPAVNMVGFRPDEGMIQSSIDGVTVWIEHNGGPSRPLVELGAAHEELPVAPVVAAPRAAPPPAAAPAPASPAASPAAPPPRPSPVPVATHEPFDAADEPEEALWVQPATRPAPKPQPAPKPEPPPAPAPKKADDDAWDDW